MKKTQFKHNLSKAKRLKQNERETLNNIFKGYSQTLIDISEPYSSKWIEDNRGKDSPLANHLNTMAHIITNLSKNK